VYPVCIMIGFTKYLLYFRVAEISVPFDGKDGLPDSIEM